MQFYDDQMINDDQIMTFRLYTVYNKHYDDKNANQIREKSQVLSQVLQ